jgi:ABC-type lipoprotein release transport system permease subunit
VLIAVRLALRNLLRNRWRSALTLAAVAVAVGLMVWTLGMYDGWIDEMVRGTTAVETGQIQVHTAEYVENPRVYESYTADSTLMRRLRGLPGVTAVSPRVKAYGLVGNEDRSQVARIVGVIPEAEGAATPIRDAVVSGRWLSPGPAPARAPREVVLGRGLAQQLRVSPGDELVVFLEAADGSLGNELLQVTGVVRTGNTELDRLAAYVHLADAQSLTALGDQIHELMLRTADLDAARATAESVAVAIGARLGAPADGETVEPSALVVQPWQQIVPWLNQMIVLFRRSYAFMYLLIYLVAAVGILNTARMSALERRREFGVMLAIGMRPLRMFRTIVVETVVLGLAGALIGAALGFLLSWYYATAGFDMRMFTDQATFSYMGVAFSERIYFVVTPMTVIQPVLVMLAVAALSGLWPAIRAARIVPAPTIAGRT